MTRQARPEPARRAKLWDNASYGLAWLTLGMVYLFLVTRFGPGHGREEILYSSDAMFIPVFFGDVVARGSLAGWDLPTSPFFFPDMLLFIPLLAAVPNIRIATLLFGLLQLLCMSVGLLWLQRHLFAGKRAAQTVMLLALALCLVIIATGYQAVFPFALTSVHHMGVLLLMPFATVTLLRALQPPDVQPPGMSLRDRALFLLCALTLLTAHSETLFIIQFVLPALVALVLWGKGQQVSWRYLGLIGGGLLLAAAAGQWLRRFVVPPEKLLLYTHLEPVAMATAWANFGAWASELVRTDPVFVLVWAIGLVALVGIIGSALLNRQAKSRMLALVATLALVSMVVSVAAALVSGNFIDAYATRYILPTVYLPLLIGLPVGLARVLERWAARQRTKESRTLAPHLLLAMSSLVAGVGMVVLLATAPRLSMASLQSFAAYQEPFIACLQDEATQRQLRYGLAGFWQAAKITALTEGRLEVLAAENDLAPLLWNNNRHRYAAPFEFVVIGEDTPRDWGIERQFVTRHFGPPRDEFVCDDQTILVYNRPGDVPIRTWFAHHPDMVQLHQPGDVAELYGYTLPSHIGAVPVGLSQGASEQWDQDEGTLVYAPLKQLGAGSYAVRLDLFADDDESGEWEVVTFTTSGREVVHREVVHREVLQRAPISQSGVHTITSHFDLRTGTDVDIVVKYNGRGALYVDRMVIARVDPAHATAFTFREPPAATETGALHLLYPSPGSTVEGGVTDFVWQWTGAPLPPGETFEVRLWRAGEKIHFGAHDAVASQAAIRRIGDTYLLRLDVRGAHSVIQHGAGDYAWTVARVAVEPAYQDLQQEAAPFALHIEP